MKTVQRMANMKTLLIVVGLVVITATTNARSLRGDMENVIENRASDDVRFFLYTKANPSAAQELITDDVESVRKSNFDKSRHTKVLIHGWGGSYTSSPNRPVREAYLSQQDYNIISVDWNPYSKLNYISARSKVPLVGEEIAEFLQFLKKHFGLDFDMLVVVGHSLGAHVAGFCGKAIGSGVIAGIVGLDPAFPLYSFENDKTRLADTDAKYVESIQTNGNTKGFLRPIGSASFYPNWGRLQPGCGTDLDGTCSHARSVTLYAEAVRGYSFAPIFKCSSYSNISDKSPCKDFEPSVEIGDPLQIRRINGIFYFETNAEAPFGHWERKSLN